MAKQWQYCNRELPEQNNNQTALLKSKNRVVHA